MHINPYISFDGACAEAFRFYARVLGAEIVMMMTYAESPMAEQVAPEARNRIMHAQLLVGGTTLMGSDAPMGYQPAAGFHVSLVVKTVEEAQHAFAGLSDGGTVRMPLAATFWSPAFGMLTDKFGTPWMVNCMPAA